MQLHETGSHCVLIWAQRSLLAMAWTLAASEIADSDSGNAF